MRLPRSSLTKIDETKPSQLTAQVQFLGAVLGAMKLDLPPYQPPYTWSVKSTGDLGDGIRRLGLAGHYRIGTFILHEPLADPGEITATAVPRSDRGTRLDIVEPRKDGMT